MTIRVRTREGGSRTIPEDRLAELTTTFRGRILGPEDADYDEVRVVQNAMIDRRPGMVVECSGTADVIDALKLAREEDLLVAVRGGGHSVAGHCIADDCLLVDLSRMRGVWVDSERRIVRVQGGATWGDVDRETQAFGLAVPGGIVSTTGVGGLTLGGGIGWLHRKYGLACDSLRSAEVVTAEGEVVQASESRNPDLFWALKGGGGNFGVVTTFEFEAHRLGPIVMCAGPIYPIEEAGEIFPAWRDWASETPDEVTSRAIFWHLPAAPQLPPSVHDRQVLILGAVHSGPPEVGEEALRPIREFGTPLADLSAPMPYRLFQAAFDPLFPRGQMGSYWKSVYLEELTDDVVNLILQRAADRPTPETIVHVPQMGGATSRVGSTETAFGDRSAAYMLSVDGNWWDPADADRVTRWVREFVEEVGALPEASGTYLNFSGDADGAPHLLDAAFGDNLEKLARVKRDYDPDNRFRLNDNILPTA